MGVQSDSFVMEDATYSAKAKISRGHNLSLKGDIAVNFYYQIPTDVYSGELTIGFVYKVEGVLRLP